MRKPELANFGSFYKESIWGKDSNKMGSGSGIRNQISHILDFWTITPNTLTLTQNLVKLRKSLTRQSLQSTKHEANVH